MGRGGKVGENRETRNISGKEGKSGESGQIGKKMQTSRLRINAMVKKTTVKITMFYFILQLCVHLLVKMEGCVLQMEPVFVHPDLLDRIAKSVSKFTDAVNLRFQPLFLKCYPFYIYLIYWIIFILMHNYFSRSLIQYRRL